jgi:hypothetical protein
MSKEKLFLELIKSLSKNREINSSAYNLLLHKGKDLGYNKETVNLLLEMESVSINDEISDFNDDTFDDNVLNNNDYDNEHLESEKTDFDEVHVFKSAITRGGSILTPDIIKVTKTSVIYRKRNKYLINVDSVSIPISKISSVEIDTSIWGTDIIIKSFGMGKIIVKKFTKTDAKTIQKLIEERQNTK